MNRLSSLNSSLAGQFTFGYDALSRRTQLARPNGINTNYSYDSLSRLLSVLHQAGSTTIDGASYVYDAAGNRTTKTNQLNNVTEGYTYDPLYQLTQVAQGATTTESYSYDVVGNRLSSMGVSSYNYSSSNQLTSTSSATYTYDNNGNTLTKADTNGTTQYTWDSENRLTSVVLPGTGGTASFKYDPLGRRIQKSSASGTANYLYDGLDLIEELDSSGNIQARYVQSAGIDAPLSELRSGNASYYEQDAIGSTTSLSSGAGALANTYSYDTFGNLSASTGTIPNPFRYTAREFDPETQTYYYRARYYDPTSGRFLSEDPIRFRGGLDFYGYVWNSTPNLSDPTGQFPKSWHRDQTFDLARAVFGGKCIDKARAVADADAAVDDLNRGIGWGAIGTVIGGVQFLFHGGEGWTQPGPHFPNAAMLDHLHNNAMQSCNPEALGEFLHSIQDAWAHSGLSSFDHYTHGTTPDGNAVNDLNLQDDAMLDTIRQLLEFKAKCLVCCQ